MNNYNFTYNCNITKNKYLVNINNIYNFVNLIENIVYFNNMKNLSNNIKPSN